MSMYHQSPCPEFVRVTELLCVIHAICAVFMSDQHLTELLRVIEAICAVFMSDQHLTELLRVIEAICAVS